MGSEFESRNYKRRKNAVCRSGEAYHRKHHVLCVSKSPLFIFVNSKLETLERKYRLTKGFYNRYSTNILHRLRGHFFKCILILLHILRHFRTHHKRAHKHKCDERRDKANKSKPPVEYEHHNKQTHRGRN